MLCAISGEAPEVPVASRKSGNVFEKRLIEAYIAENGKEPVTGEELSVDDLVDLKTARIVKPRPPTLTSIPSLLSVFQNEWDALALETFTLKQQLSQTRQELSNALYNNDAAVRVIARLTRERDEARDALGKTAMNERRVGSAAAGNGDAMHVDAQGLPEAISAKVEATQEKLSKTRRKRPIPNGWVTTDDIREMKATANRQLLPPGSRVLALHKDNDLALLGGSDGSILAFSMSDQKVTHLPKSDGAVLQGLWFGSQPAVATSRGIVAIYSESQPVSKFSTHAGAANGISLHPTGDILASVGSDKSFVFYDLSELNVLTQVYTSSELLCCQFHPDGHLFAAGGSDGQIKIFDVKSFSNVANFECSGPVQSLSFSENGTWLAAAIKDSTSVTIWDLRKAAELKSLEFGSIVEFVQWDYTGQFLVGAGPGGVGVQYYDKTNKVWSELLRKAVASSVVEWGPLGKSLSVLTKAGELGFLR